MLAMKLHVKRICPDFQWHELRQLGAWECRRFTKHEHCPHQGFVRSAESRGTSLVFMLDLFVEEAVDLRLLVLAGADRNKFCMCQLNECQKWTARVPKKPLQPGQTSAAYGDVYAVLVVDFDPEVVRCAGKGYPYLSLRLQSTRTVSARVLKLLCFATSEAHDQKPEQATCRSVVACLDSS